jgi:hypothetical protein
LPYSNAQAISVLSRVDDSHALSLSYGFAEPAVLRIAGISCSTVLRVREAAVNTCADTLAIALGEGECVYSLAARATRTGDESAQCFHGVTPVRSSSMNTAPSNGLWQ